MDKGIFSKPAQRHPKVYLLGAIPFAIMHLICFAVIWTGVTMESLIICITLYLTRMLAITAGYHRYFSHKSYQTSRTFQFILAFLAQTSMQRGVLQWANDHRRHHLFSDTFDDVHSPGRQGFLYAHVGWIFANDTYDLEYKMVTDFKKYPEIVWINKHKYLPGLLLAILVLIIGGWPGLIVGFFISTVLLYHATFCINSLAHVHGGQRYLTGDDSRNNAFLSVITLGEGWHNNHHHYPVSSRQGFFWWEYDITYYILKLLASVGIVWNLKTPPVAVKYNTSGFSERELAHTKKLFAALDFDLESIITRLEAIKNAPIALTPASNVTELTAIIEMLKIRLQMVYILPQKLARLVDKDLKECIRLLCSLIDTHAKMIKVPTEEFISVIGNVLNILSLHNSLPNETVENKESF